MARPSKNNADYFPHFTTMRNHRKVKVLRNKFGSVLGYAFWCMIIEWLTEQDGLEWEDSETECEMFASELGVSAAEIRQMLDYCLKLQLLFKTNSGFIYSESLNDSLKSVFEKRQREKERSKARKRKEDGTFKTDDAQIVNVSAAEIPQIKVNEIKQQNTIPDSIESSALAEGKKNSELSFAEKAKLFIKTFNEITNKSHRKLTSKAERQFKARLNEGYTGKELVYAIRQAAKAKNHIDSNYVYLTPELITRADTLEMYLNAKEKNNNSATGGAQIKAKSIAAMALEQETKVWR